jgi:hypothetical protein
MLDETIAVQIWYVGVREPMGGCWAGWLISAGFGNEAAGRADIPDSGELAQLACVIYARTSALFAKIIVRQAAMSRLTLAMI